jgi:hypothetical protein
MNLQNMPSAEDIKKEGGKVEHLSPAEIQNSVGCDHYFILSTTREAQCNNCYVIVRLSAGDIVNDGKLVLTQKR